MKRAKLLLTNIFVYGFGGIISKIIPLIMVPIITRLMPNSFYYGIADLSTTIVALFSALALMGMYDAMYRYFFENNDDYYKIEICSSAFFFTALTATIVTGLMVVFNEPISALFYGDKEFGDLVILCSMSVLIGATNSIVSAPTRMQNKKILYLVMNTIAPILSYLIAIPLIINGWHLIALPLASLISVMTMEISFMFLNRKWFSIKHIRLSHIKSMLIISLPLALNFLAYWVFNSSDRVMIANMLDPSQEGIYSVAGKVGHVTQLISTAFYGGWQYFAFSIMKDKDNKKLISVIIEALFSLTFICTILGTTLCKYFMQILFTEEYLFGYICIPYLFMAPLLQMFLQIGSSQFMVVKKTWPNPIILGIGVAANIGLNYILIPMLGVEGASVATFIGYSISTLITMIALKKLNLIDISIKLIANSAIFITIFMIMRFNEFSNIVINLILTFIFLGFNYYLYQKQIKQLFVYVYDSIIKRNT